MNRFAASLVGIMVIAGVLYQAPGPAPATVTPVALTGKAPPAPQTQGPVRRASGGPSSREPGPCTENDGPWTALAQFLRIRDDAKPKQPLFPAFLNNSAGLLGTTEFLIA